MTTPYTYLIKWSEQNLHYYGVRYAKNCDPADLWEKYFTSSKYVAEAREKYGEPDIIQIRKIFDLEDFPKGWSRGRLTKKQRLVNSLQ